MGQESKSLASLKVQMSLCPTLLILLLVGSGVFIEQSLFPEELRTPGFRCRSKILCVGAIEVAQQLNAHPALAEFCSLVPRVHAGKLTTACNSNPRMITPLVSKDVYTQKHTYPHRSYHIWLYMGS